MEGINLVTSPISANPQNNLLIDVLRDRLKVSERTNVELQSKVDTYAADLAGLRNLIVAIMTQEKEIVIHRDTITKLDLNSTVHTVYDNRDNSVTVKIKKNGYVT